MDAVTGNRLIERAHKQIERRTNALQQTLDEYKLVEELEAKNPGAYTYAIAALRTKRDRQHKALESAKQFLAVIQSTLKTAPKRA
jgi:hypothetical protein